MRYGDYDQVTNDVKTLNEVLSRQGSNLLIDVLAEQSGRTAAKFKFSEDDRLNLMTNLISELKEALLERL